MKLGSVRASHVGIHRQSPAAARLHLLRQRLGFSFAFSMPSQSGSPRCLLASILVVAVIFPPSLARVLSSQ
ncbi:hypothetical protein TIFTF001_020660 [Ficus carica]|uniref:Uncharacterized protein n=1 Tax=Ficus carica TaxID=3494 RepID=A0AA88AE67_FICCA|nr:hypothetical protein TIFTF001_020660 [Ficus carica]